MLISARMRSSTSWSSARCIFSRVMSSRSSTFVPCACSEARRVRTSPGRSRYLWSAPKKSSTALQVLFGFAVTGVWT
ncbi:hypothetical protein ABH931_005377 [Streptacidiphilus sp. MAP12-33]